MRFTEHVLNENGSRPARATVRVSVAAVVSNPWVGTDARTDLSGETRSIAPRLAQLLSEEVLAATDGASAVEAFGKAALVGSQGEVEHGAALIHTPYFGNLVREYLEGDSIICFNDARMAAGDLLTVPLWHKSAAATRSHYQSFSVRVPDAPRADEIVVALVASTGPRPHPRIGDRTTDPAITSRHDSLT